MRAEPLAPGATLEPVELVVGPEVMHRYGVVAQDFNPIHFSDDAARALGLPGRIAHGMISGGLLGRMLARHLGEAWLRRGTLRVKFVRPVLVGERVVARGEVVGTDPLVVAVRVENAHGDAVIVGEAGLAGGAAAK